MLDRTILDGIRVASPCSASWDEMVGDDRTRFCSGCKKDVYNISGLTTEEAIGLVSTDGQAPCVRFYRRPDQTVMTADCPVEVTKVRRRLIRRVAGVGVVGLAMAASGLTAMGFSRRQNALPMPSGPNVTLDDWIDWGMVTVGLRQRRPVIMGGLCAPPMLLPTTSGTAATPVMGESEGEPTTVTPTPLPPRPTGMILGKRVAAASGEAVAVPPPVPAQP